MYPRSIVVSAQTYDWGQQLLCLTPLATLLCAMAAWLGTGEELAAYYAQVSLSQPRFTALMTGVTHAVNPLFYFLYAGLLLLGMKRRDRQLIRLALAYLVVQLAVSFLLVRILKISIGKPRPDALLDGRGYEFFSFKHGNHAFPSGHSTEVVTSVTPLALRWQKPFLSLIFGLVVALVGYSRIYLGMHHIADIVAGMMIGTVSGFLIHHFSIRGAS